MANVTDRQALIIDTAPGGQPLYHTVDSTHVKVAGAWREAPRKWIKVGGAWQLASWPLLPKGGILTINEKDIGSGRLEYGMDIGAIPVEGSITGDDTPVDDMRVKAIRIRAAATAKAFILVEFSYHNGHTLPNYTDFPATLEIQLDDDPAYTYTVPRVNNTYSTRIRYQIHLDDNNAYNLIKAHYDASETMPFRVIDTFRKVTDLTYVP